jgi:beta-galactosidase
MDPGWKFHLGDIPAPVPNTHDIAYGWNGAKSGQFRGGAAVELNDSAWRAVNLPHDWMVEGRFSPDANMSQGYLPAGIAWYRKTFLLPPGDEGRRLFLEFDGVFRDATVYLNGHRLGAEPSGYIGARYEITDQAVPGEENVLAVRVDATAWEGWWYEGAGIYRHVWLVKTAAVGVAPGGVFVSARVAAKDGRAEGPAEIRAQTTLANAEDAEVRGEWVATVLDPEGRVAAEGRSGFELAPGGEFDGVQTLRVEQPRLWSVDAPLLYRLRTSVVIAGTVVDAVETPFGIRTLRFDADKGFFLNEKPLKLKGASNHQDHAGVGVALPDRLFEFRIEQLKRMGANAWRCAHHPPAPEFLDACDRLGMLVMDETRCMDSTADGLRQLAGMVTRDRNHPSVVLWSLGNEEPHQMTGVGRRIIRSMKRLVRRLDPTRPVTLAMNGGWGEPVSPLLDVQGCNYNIADYDTYHRQYPAQPMVGSETSAAMGTRGEYETDPKQGYVSAYDVQPPAPFAASAEDAWRKVADRDFIAGTFPWTGFDYRGEPLPTGWPCVGSNFGILDSCGFPKDNFYYYQAWWTDRVVLHLLPHWNWPGREGREIAVWCHSNCERVELFQDGRSLGAKEMPRNGHLEWKVTYAPGVLLARGFKHGAWVAEEKVETTGAPCRIALSADRDACRADGEDVAVLRVSVLDDAGRLVPYADTEVTFAVSGQGRLLGTGNGDPASHESDKASRRRAFHGLCMAIVQTTRTPGEIVIEAGAPGLAPARLRLPSLPGAGRPFVPAVDRAKRLNLFDIGTARTTRRDESLKDEWVRPAFNDTGWEAFALVAKPRLPSHSYTRIRFAVPAGLESAELVADLGAIHDFDETWLNGIRLGSTVPANTTPENAWKTRRFYKIPAGLLKPGAENLLAIHSWNIRTTPDAWTFIMGPMRIYPA